MIHFLQPIVSLAVGLALSVYGLIHAATHVPSGGHVETLWSSLPALSAVLVFGLGLVAAVAGLVLTTVGSQGLRKRYRQIDTAFKPRTPEPFEEDGPYAYR